MFDYQFTVQVAGKAGYSFVLRSFETGDERLVFSLVVSSDAEARAMLNDAVVFDSEHIADRRRAGVAAGAAVGVESGFSKRGHNNLKGLIYQPSPFGAMAGTEFNFKIRNLIDSTVHLESVEKTI